MSAKGVDIAIFHQLPPLSGLMARICDIPCRVFLDHGTSFPVLSGFDLIVVSNLDGFPLDHSYYHNIGSNIVDLPMLTESRDTWEAQTYPKSWFNLPDDAKIVTTVSNHLDDRLSPECCWAISEILKKVPRAYYVPIGPIQGHRLAEIFKQLGVGDRVIFLGNQFSPSQLLRSMDLYLNEFPFGGSIGVLDGMASGVPVVTMFNPEGAPQGRYAALYMGLDHAVQTKENYIELACRLLTDQTIYEEWSAHTLKRYEERVNPSKYVKDLEALIENHIRAKDYVSGEICS
jgi:glycosyltransferase involved in cell wall biosynthesis